MKKNLYREMKERQQKEVNAFDGWFFAYSQDQFAEGMKRVGLLPDETDKIYHVMSGCYVLRSRSDAMQAMFDAHERELKEAIAADSTGEGFIKDMFLEELNNHEFGYTGDTTDALMALGLTADEVVNDPTLNHGAALAMSEIMAFAD